MSESQRKRRIIELSVDEIILPECSSSLIHDNVLSGEWTSTKVLRIEMLSGPPEGFC
jgi:hypothetical protein